MADLRYDVAVGVTADTKRAEASLGSFATRMKRDLTKAVRSIPDLHIGADSTDAEVEIAAIRADLKELSRLRPGVDIDATLARARIDELAGRLRKLSTDSADIQVIADTEAAIKALGYVEQKREKLDGSTATVKVDAKGVDDTVFGMSKLTLGLAGVTAAGPAAGLAIAAGLAGASAAFLGVAAIGLASSERVKSAWTGLGKTIKADLVADTESLVPVVAGVADKLGATFERLRPLIRDAFAELPDQIDHAAAGVDAFATRSMPGLVHAVQAADPIFAGLESALGKIGTGAGAFFDEISRAAGPAGSILDQVGGIVERLLPTLGRLLTVATQIGSGGLPVFTAALGAALDVLDGLLSVLEPIAPALGMIAAGFLAVRVGAAGLSAVQGVVTTLATKLESVALNAGVATEKITGSAAAGEKAATAGQKMSGALTKVGNALPVVGAGVIAVGLAYETFGSKADEAAQKVVDGSLSMRAAIAQEAEQVHSNQIEWLGGMNAQESYAVAAKNVTDAVAEQRAAMSPMQQLTSDVARAQADLNDAVVLFGENSPQAVTAAGNLATATDKEKAAHEGAARAIDGQKQSLQNLQTQILLSLGAEAGYEQSVHAVEAASKTVTEAIKDHGVKSLETRDATDQLNNSILTEIDAAGRQAVATSGVTDETDKTRIATEASLQKLLELSRSQDGPVRDAANAMIGKLSETEQQTLKTMGQSQQFKDELQRLADKSNGPLKDALEEGKRKLDEIGQSHSTADEKARLQKEMLQKLADQTTGPTHDAIQGLITDLGNIPKVTTLTVHGVGDVSYGSPELTRAAHGGATGGVVGMGRSGLTGVAYATGGVTPGYTPGRDVHRFHSATGGTLDLSGGEAIMRPEWTRAVGVDYVNRANAAARAGRFADGGIYQWTGTPLRQIVPQLYNTVAGSLARTITGVIESAIKTLIAQVKAMAAAAASAVGGAIGIGGGSARAFIIAHESGGNPTARNPTSTASGLYQMINGTWKAYGGSTPTAAQASVAEQNAVADRYVAARYGSWENAAAFWRAHSWYKSGGIIPTHTYDRGGMLPTGASLAVNNTGRPELVVPARGGDGGELLSELKRLNSTMTALRGDVDGHTDGAVAGQLAVVARLLAAGGGSAATAAAGARSVSTFGAF